MVGLFGKSLESNGDFSMRCQWLTSNLLRRYVSKCDEYVVVKVRRSPTLWGMGRTKFTTSGAHDVIAITSPWKNDLCTEELQDKAKSLDEVSLPLRKATFGCLFLGRERGL